jgi:cyclic-di-GMP-binding biofilm dispersal mediator protein
MWLAKRVAPTLQASQGFFVNLSGVVAESPMPGMAAYSASKAAAAAATEAIRREFRRMKVTVIDVRPPHTETGLATRPLAGDAPRMPQGLEPGVVAERVVTAIEHGDTAVASTDFTS